MQRLNYSVSNESLTAIVYGLDLNQADVVYGIGGSGDVLFAALEYVDSVVGIDNNPIQVQLMKERAELLRQSDYNSFLNIEDIGDYDGCFNRRMPGLAEFNLKRRNAYFRRQGINRVDQTPYNRLSRISEKIDRLTIIEGDFFEEAAKSEGFSKLYLSNFVADSIWPSAADNGQMEPCLKQMLKTLRNGGLVYFSIPDFFMNVVKYHLDRWSRDEMPHRFILEKRLTDLARDIELNSTEAFNSPNSKPLLYPIVLKKVE